MQSPPGACRSLAHRCGAATHEPAQQPVNPDLLNIFEVFLPQLLLYPNPADPLNGEAAAMLIREPEAYARRVRGALPDSSPGHEARDAVGGSVSSCSQGCSPAAPTTVRGWAQITCSVSRGKRTWRQLLAPLELRGRAQLPQGAKGRTTTATWTSTCRATMTLRTWRNEAPRLHLACSAAAPWVWYRWT